MMPENAENSPKNGGKTPKNTRKRARNDPKSPKNAQKDVELKGKSGVPMFLDAPRAGGKDTDGYGNTFESFAQSGIIVGSNQGYGGEISDTWRLFYSQREPVGVWWVTNVANDIWDNWFSVRSVLKPDDPKLDNDVQRQMILLKARQVIPRETIFERRYGTALLLLGYMEHGMDWRKPLFEPILGEKLPDLKDGTRLLQITPYPKTAITNIDVDSDENSPRRGLPEFYTINIGAVDNTQPIAANTNEGEIVVHWTRVIHDAPRLDEHPYYGESAIDPLFDDLVGGRNARWGMYQGYYRNGQGFPVITTKATKKENEDWVANGGIDEVMNARGYFVCGEGEGVDFKGAQASALNPTSYFDTYFSFISAATSVTADVIKGISAGRISGNEAGERKYFKVVSLLQHQKELMLRELIDRLIQTRQVEFEGEYFIEWIDPFEVNPQDKASIDYLLTRKAALQLQYMKIDEVRAQFALPPLPDGAGEELLPQPGQFGQTAPSTKGAANQEKPAETREPEQPKENPAEQNKSVAGESEERLIDRVMAEAK